MQEVLRIKSHELKSFYFSSALTGANCSGREQLLQNPQSFPVRCSCLVWFISLPGAGYQEKITRTRTVPGVLK